MSQREVPVEAPAPLPEIDVSLEESALFEPEKPQHRALRAMPTPPPRPRPSTLPPPRFDAEQTTKCAPDSKLLRALREELEGIRVPTPPAIPDFAKTIEEPAIVLDDEDEDLMLATIRAKNDA